MTDEDDGVGYRGLGQRRLTICEAAAAAVVMASQRSYVTVCLVDTKRVTCG